MSIDVNTSDNYNLEKSGPKKEKYIGLPDELKAPVSTEVHEKTSQIKDAVEAKNIKDFCREAVYVLTEDEDRLQECYKIFGIDQNGNNPLAQKQCFKDFSKHIEDIASYFVSGNTDLQKVDFNRRKGLFIKAIQPESLKITYAEVCNTIRNTIPETKNTNYGNMSVSDLIESRKRELEESKTGSSSPEKKDTAVVFSTLNKSQKESSIKEVNNSIPSESNGIKDINAVFEKFDSGSKSEGDKKVLESMKEKVSVDKVTGELTLLESVKFGDVGELVLSPDKKGVVLKGYGYEYKFSTFDTKSLEISLNKISSLNFMENTGLTSFTPQEMKDISRNLNKYFDITNGIPINLDKPEGFTQAEKHELLAIFKKLKVIPFYDSNDLTKRIITKAEFTNNLKYKTDFYKGKGQLNLMTFDDNIKRMTNKKEPTRQNS